MRYFLCLILLGSGLAGAAEKEGRNFAAEHVIGDTRLILSGVGLLKVAVIFKVYVAALYLGEGVGPERVFEDVPKRLEVSYLRRITTNMIFEAGAAALSDNVPADTLARLQPRVRKMNSLYQDVDNGDRYAITYIPGYGTELSLNGESKGVIEGSDFAAAYFTIWLGANVAKPELRDALLGKK